MIGLVMAGGRGSRMKTGGEKLLLRYKRPVVMHVIDALRDSMCFQRVRAATSDHSPKTRSYLVENNIEIMETGGDGYSQDLNQALRQTNDPVLVASGDMPLLDETIVRQMVLQYDPDKTWTSFVVTREFLESLGLQSEMSVSCGGRDCAYTGISMINAQNITDYNAVKEDCTILDDKRIAFNLNTVRDCELLGTA